MPMNEELQNFARAHLKEGLAKCTEDEQLLFKRMYAHENLEVSIEDAVDNMEERKLDWAMQQVHRSLAKKGNAPNAPQ